jgi:RNA polymerase sigma-70 factor (ECF subfamily)
MKMNQPWRAGVVAVGYTDDIPTAAGIGQENFEIPALPARIPTRIMIPEPSCDQGEREPHDHDRMAFQRFGRQLIGLARRHLGAQLQHKVDPEDVVQSVYKSLLLRYGQDALAAEDWQGLWGLLTTITVRKCADRARFHRAEQRDIRREVRASESAAAFWTEAISREPTPDHAVVLAEVIESLLRQLEADERTIIEMSLQGFTTQEISEQTGRAERSVRRLRERVRIHLERQQTDTLQ